MTTPDFRPPDSAYAQAVQWTGMDDPLVTPPGIGVNGWFQRISGVFKRSGKSLALIFVITQLAPTIVLAVAGVLLTARFLMPFQKELIDASLDQRDPQFDIELARFLGFLGVLAVVVFALFFLQPVSYTHLTLPTIYSV